MNNNIFLTILIPLFNEGALTHLTAILENVVSCSGVEVICVGEHKSSSCRDLLSFYGVSYLEVKTNLRSKRFNAGIEIAKGDLILLHHPRSVLQTKAIECLVKNKMEYEWGGFTHSFDLRHPLLNFTSWYSNFVRADLRSIFYLDHCIFFKRSLFFDSLDIVPNISIFEDTAFCMKLRMLGRGKRLAMLSVTSSLRFRKNGLFRQSLINQVLKLGFYLNFSNELMNKIYEKGLSLNSKY